jgi:hypothetical protein
MTWAVMSLACVGLVAVILVLLCLSFLPGNKAALHAPFVADNCKKSDGSCKSIYVCYTEKSINLRKKLIRGSKTINQVKPTT